MERFSKYGKVVGIEYERRFKYAEARVMFETKRAAESAMLYEVCGHVVPWLTQQNGATIDGQSIRVRDRRIPPQLVNVSPATVISVANRSVKKCLWTRVDVLSTPPTLKAMTPFRTEKSSTMLGLSSPPSRWVELQRKTTILFTSRFRVCPLSRREWQLTRFLRTWFV